MGLQLRLTDSLGERLIELDARPADQANVVGRAADAEVEVPSSGISKRHCLLFVHEGRWVVQDAGSSGGTFVNGKRLTGPAFVDTGDTIALGGGSNPPTLAVDPHHIGVSEASDEGWAAAPLPPPAPRVPAPWSSPVMPSPGPALPPPPVARQSVSMPARGAPAYAVPGYSQPADPPQEEQATGWENVAPTKNFYVPKRKRASGGMIAVFVVLSVGIAVGGCYWLYATYQKKMAADKLEVVLIKPKALPQQRPSSMFDFGKEGEARATTQAGTQAVTKARAGTPASSDMAGTDAAAEAPVDKRRQDPEWLAVEQSRYEEPVLAVVKFNDYLERFPNTPFKKDVDQYIDDAADRLWWKRLTELFQERDAAQKEIADRKLQISQSQDAEFKKGLEAEIARFAERRDRADETIRVQMKFTGQSPPNVYDSQDLAIGRANRDAAYYSTWKEQVLSTIKHSRGQRLPWRSSR